MGWDQKVEALGGMLRSLDVFPGGSGAGVGVGGVGETNSIMQ